MNEFNKKEEMGFLLRFCKSKSVSSFNDTFPDILRSHLQCLSLDLDADILTGCRKKHNRHIENFLNKVKNERPRRIHVFVCSCGRMCLSIPVIQGDKIYGYMLGVHLKRSPDKKELSFIKVFIDITLKEFQKEEELSRLYDTIRPRAIALSTIHTIHRLLSSTLDLDELIERIARLASQVMRVGYCSILLFDDSRRYLMPKAIIDIRNNNKKTHRKYRKIKAGSKIEGKVSKTGKISLLNNSLCIPLIEEDIIGAICVKNKINNMHFNKFDLEILQTLAEQAVIAIKNAQLYEEQKKTAYGSIKSLAALLDAKSPHTYTHSEQFVKIALAIAEEMKLSRDELRNLRYATLLPDTGKFSIPDDILKKQGGLSKQEFDIIKKQHLESLKILEPLEFLKPVIPIIAHHHERFDGSGYPNRLKGKDIPLGARIMAVADTFEAMFSSRPYKHGKITMAQVVKEIKNNSGIQFDPAVVDAFISLTKKPRFKELFSLNPVRKDRDF